MNGALLGCSSKANVIPDRKCSLALPTLESKRTDSTDDIWSFQSLLSNVLLKAYVLLAHVLNCRNSINSCTGRHAAL